MLPVKLVIEGLNSYADRVDIDFKRFYDKRIFGIFGDTGAGKSTILDAIFLALYGKTPRLGGRNIDRAINPTKTKINISFTFRMSNKEYRVERTINKVSKVKLCEIDKTVKALADKSSDVEHELYEIIGLTYDEFCKVVILPQNEFAELLKMKESERSIFIGHLFDLGVYGKSLADVVNKHFNNVESEKRVLETQLNNLKDISEESVTKIQMDLKDMIDKKDILEKEYAELSNRKQLYDKIRDLNKKMRDKERELKDLEKMEDEIRKMKERLKVDEEMTAIKNVYSEWKRITNFLNENLSKRDGAEKRLAEIVDNIKKIEREKQEFENSYKDRQGILIKKISEAQEAMNLYREIDQLNKEAAEIENNINRSEQELVALDREINRADEDIEKANSEIEKMENEIRKLTLSEEENRLLNVLPDVVQRKVEIANRERELKSKGNLLSEKKEKYKSVFERMSGKIASKLGLAIDSHDGVMRLIDGEIDSLERLFREKDQKLEELRIIDMSVEISRHLKDGEPCPVCGSLEHPSPAKGERGEEIRLLLCEIDSIRKKIEELRNFKEREIDPLIKECISLDASIRQIYENIEEIKNFIEERRREILSITTEEILNNAENIYADLKKRQIKRGDLGESLKRLYQKLNEKKDLRGAKITKKTELSARLGEWRDRLNRLRYTINDKTEELRIKTGGRRPEDLKNEAESNLRELDRHRSKLERLLTDNMSEKKGMEAQIESISFAIEEAKKRIEELEKAISKKAEEMGVLPDELKRYFLEDGEKEVMKKKIEKYERDKNFLYGELGQIKRQMEELPQKSLPEGEPERTYELLKKLGDDIGELNRKIGGMEERINKEKKLLEEKANLFNRLKEIEENLNRITILKNLIRGDGMEKYLSSCLMKEIIEYSNKLLDDIMGKRLHLRVLHDLSFEVRDLQYNSIRDVDTISGGELFVLSFALALSLSKYIQHKRRKEIKFFFIDEGFSSLDKGLLDSIYLVLNEIRSYDKLVGLISHIDDLRRVVPQYLYVKRDHAGASKIDVY